MPPATTPLVAPAAVVVSSSVHDAVLVELEAELVGVGEGSASLDGAEWHQETPSGYVEDCRLAAHHFLPLLLVGFADQRLLEARQVLRLKEALHGLGGVWCCQGGG